MYYARTSLFSKFRECFANICVTVTVVRWHTQKALDPALPSVRILKVNGWSTCTNHCFVSLSRQELLFTESWIRQRHYEIRNTCTYIMASKAGKGDTCRQLVVSGRAAPGGKQFWRWMKGGLTQTAHINTITLRAFVSNQAARFIKHNECVFRISDLMKLLVFNNIEQSIKAFQRFFRAS